VKDGEHGCLLYLDEWNRQRILFHFLKQSLLAEYLCVYATATQSLEEARQSMKLHGLDLKDNALDKASLFVVRGEDLYGAPEKPDIARWLFSIQSTYDNAIRDGKRGLRIAADLSSYFLNHGFVKQWFELESSLETKIDAKIAIICAYDVSEAPSKDALSVVHFYKDLFTSSSSSSSLTDKESTVRAKKGEEKEVHGFAVIPFDDQTSMIVRF
jgi:hypothetical protein